MLICTILTSFRAFANEDHLVLVPTLIQDEGDGGEVYTIQVPLVSGYGANFEGYIGRITDPYIADYHSPSTDKGEVDLNPASIAGLRLSAVLARDNVYDVAIDYSEVHEDWLKDRRLLRSVVKCIYAYGDQLHHPHLKARIRVKGLKADSILEDELSKCLEKRKSALMKLKG